MGMKKRPVSNFRNSSDKGTAEEFDDGAGFLPKGRRYNQTRIHPRVNPGVGCISISISISREGIWPGMPIPHSRRGASRSSHGFCAAIEWRDRILNGRLLLLGVVLREYASEFGAQK